MSNERTIALEYPYEYQCDDRERSAFDLGWEYHRRGWAADDCPFPDGQKRDWFMEGYTSFKDVREYHRQQNADTASLI